MRRLGESIKRRSLRRAATCAVLLAATLAGCSDESAPPPAAGGAPQAGAPDAPDVCGRECLIGLLDDYLEAVVAHDPSRAPLADGFRGTQNAVETAPGEGVWTTITGLGRTQRRYADPETGQAGYVGLIGEGEKTAIAAVRVRIAERQVVEAEWVIAREGAGPFNPAGFITNPPPGPLDPGAPAPSREDALTAVDNYYQGIEQSDPSVVMATPACYRMENGFWMVGRIPGRQVPDPSEAQPGFTTALSPDADSSCVTGFANLKNVTADVLDLRSFFDAEAGVVWSAGVFQRVEGAVNRDGSPLAWLYFASIIPVEGQRVRGVYATMHYLPEDVASSGWPAGD